MPEMAIDRIPMRIPTAMIFRVRYLLFMYLCRYMYVSFLNTFELNEIVE
jgi:hypothetical protein